MLFTTKGTLCKYLYNVGTTIVGTIRFYLFKIQFIIFWSVFSYRIHYVLYFWEKLCTCSCVYCYINVV